jgi:hypothetical protein
MEGCGDELVLKRVCAPGGEGPKELVEIIRSKSRGRLEGGLLVGRSAHWMSTLLYARMVTQSKRWSFGGCVWMRHDAMQQAATRSYLVFPPVNAG